ncbi:hypothetical protein PAXINDRAFT_16889 [Paxillus involutus ATCC 200175]|uniref:Uncharacterized protein n=1 Tax=Paxillus involutus ATCC 200175 TaxID=664439 RepID=A0A0C9TQT2_PAXIN|nr:hypothetical protein PAXINDRAFT_16889 [Paxillus involutus ATCC 200175]
MGMVDMYVLAVFVNCLPAPSIPRLHSPLAPLVIFACMTCLDMQYMAVSTSLAGGCRRWVWWLRGVEVVWDANLSPSPVVHGAFALSRCCGCLFVIFPLRPSTFLTFSTPSFDSSLALRFLLVLTARVARKIPFLTPKRKSPGAHPDKS